MSFIPLCCCGRVVLLVPTFGEGKRDTRFVLWQPVGDGVHFHTALQRRFVFLLAKITTMKSVPVEECWEIKALEKRVLLEGRKGGRKYSLFVVMCTFFFLLNVHWLVGEPSICHSIKLSSTGTHQNSLLTNSCCRQIDLLSRLGVFVFLEASAVAV